MVMGTFWVLLLVACADGRSITDMYGTNGTECNQLRAAHVLASDSVIDCDWKKIYSIPYFRELNIITILPAPYADFFLLYNSRKLLVKRLLTSETKQIGPLSTVT